MITTKGIIAAIIILLLWTTGAEAYFVSGKVYNGTTGAVEPGVSIKVNGQTVTTTNGDGSYSFANENSLLNFTLTSQKGSYTGPEYTFNLSAPTGITALNFAVSFNKVLLKLITNKTSNIINVGEVARLNLSIDPAGNGITCLQVMPVYRGDLISFVSGSLIEGNLFNRGGVDTAFRTGPELGNYSQIWWGLIEVYGVTASAPANFSTITIRGEKNSTSSFSLRMVVVGERNSAKVATIIVPVNITVTTIWDVTGDKKMSAGDPGAINYAIKMNWTVAQYPRGDVSGPLGMPDGKIDLYDFNDDKLHIYDTIIVYP